MPYEVLVRAKEELLSYQKTGMSIMEVSHRSSLFKSVIEKTEALLRELMNIPDQYKVLFLQGGASLQFTMVPLNLLQKGRHTYYVHTGSWSKKAMAEAKKIGDVRILASSEDRSFTYIPPVDISPLSPKTAYLHITTNNTIEGTKYSQVPNLNEINIPLVADMSSNILSEQIDVSQFGLIYAGAQKNLGIAGLTIVIIREDLLGLAPENCPSMLNYETYAKNGSMYNTPPTFSLYISMLVLEWIKEQGGVLEIEKRNIEKANLLYSYLDQSGLFYSNVRKEDRSLMNIPFLTKSEELNKLFIRQAEKEGLVSLKGHRSTGGMRASLYNAMPMEGVVALTDFMKQFEQNV